MAPLTLPSAEFYRKEAVRLRQKAGVMTHKMIRRQVLSIAAQYDGLAETVEMINRPRLKPMIDKTPLEQVKRHVREQEARVERQIELLVQLERYGHWDVARPARELLATMTETLAASRKHLELERHRQVRASLAQFGVSGPGGPGMPKSPSARVRAS